MKLTLLCMGKTRERFIQEGIEKYTRYLKHYADLDIRELKEEKVLDLKQAPVIRRKESEKIMKAVPPGAIVICLDEHGEEFTSHEFAAFLNKTIESGVREVAFVFGGALGLDERLTAVSHKVLALSRWTFTHEMARLVLLEQLYRAFTIITGKTYHY
jgi:23S rRNA (pseudouridine1915-N3)-methyltransferase